MNLAAAIDSIDKLARQQTFITKKELVLAGIDEATIAELIAQSYLAAQTESLYTLLKSNFGKYHGDVLATYEVPAGIICLGTALSFHELTSLMPSKVNLALPRGYPQVLTELPVAIQRMPLSIYQDGIQFHQHEGREIKVYNIPKTIVDCFSYPWTVGMDIALKALQEALFKNLCSVEQVRDYAAKRVLKPGINEEFETALANPEKICLYT